MELLNWIVITDTGMYRYLWLPDTNYGYKYRLLFSFPRLWDTYSCDGVFFVYPIKYIKFHDAVDQS